jgi:hypothetical protein
VEKGETSLLNSVAHVILKIVAGTKFLEALVAFKLPVLVLGLDVASEVGRRPRPVAAFRAQESPAKVERTMGIKLKIRMQEWVLSMERNVEIFVQI